MRALRQRKSHKVTQENDALRGAIERDSDFRRKKKKKKIGQRQREKKRVWVCEWVSKKEKHWLVFKAREEWFLFFLFLSLSLTIPMPYPFVRDRFCCGRAGLEVWHKEYISLIVIWSPIEDLISLFVTLWGLFVKIMAT